jgi:hypothetical protein
MDRKNELEAKKEKLRLMREAKANNLIAVCL